MEAYRLCGLARQLEQGNRTVRDAREADAGYRTNQYLANAFSAGLSARNLIV